MIEWATLYPGAELHSRKDSNTGMEEIWKGTVSAEKSRHDVYLKIQPAYKTLAEVVSAKVGQEIGLPIPKTFLLNIPADLLPQTIAPVPATGSFLAFAIEDTGEHSMSFKNILNLDDPVAKAAWFAWNRFKETLLFDEWIANADRNTGNIMWNGDFWLIDHAEALGGSYTQQNGFGDAEMLFGNMLLEEILPNLPLKARGGLDLATQKFQRDHQDYDLSALLAAPYATALSSGPLIRDIIAFLAARRICLGKMMRAKMGLPEL